MTRYVIILAYDIPVSTSDMKKRYRKFVKFIISKGFYRIQESVYIRPVRDKIQIKATNEVLKIVAPDGSNIRTFHLTFKQYVQMNPISGVDSFGEKLIKTQNSIIKF